MNSESKPELLDLAGERLDAAGALRAVALPDVRRQEDPEPADVSHERATSECGSGLIGRGSPGRVCAKNDRGALEHVVGREDPVRRVQLGRQAGVEVRSRSRGR